ncbi:MAG: cobaltochelatase subunit CobN [Candidatus Hodgkinia cicadicola]
MEILVCCDSWLQHEHYLKLFRINALGRLFRFLLLTDCFGELERLTLLLSYCSLLFVNVFDKIWSRARASALIVRLKHKLKFKCLIIIKQDGLERVYFDNKIVNATNQIVSLERSVNDGLLFKTLADSAPHWDAKLFANKLDYNRWRYNVEPLLALRYQVNNVLVCLYDVSSTVCCRHILSLCNKLLFFRVRPLPFCVKSVSGDLTDLQLALSGFAPVVMVSLTSFACIDAISVYKPVVLQLATSCNRLSKLISLDCGLSNFELCQKLSLPELEGKVFVKAIGFANVSFDCKSSCYVRAFKVISNRLNFSVVMLSRWLKLALNKHALIFVLFNYPTNDSRIGNGVGLDTIASVVNVNNLFTQLKLLTCVELIQELLLGVTNYSNLNRLTRATVCLRTKTEIVSDFVTSQVWGCADADPFVLNGFASLSFYKILKNYVMIQPTRGYGLVNPNIYHSAFAVPCRAYWLCYFYCKRALTHTLTVNVGKHGSLEWLPGRANTLSRSCYPELVGFGLLNLYFYILNDPGEGTQAKRRTSSIIIDHYLPPILILDKLVIADFESASKGYSRFSQKYYCNLLGLQFRNGLHVIGLFKILSVVTSLAALLKWRFNLIIVDVCNRIVGWNLCNYLDEHKALAAFYGLFLALHVSSALLISLKKSVLLSMASCYYELYSVIKSVNAKYVLPGLSSSWSRADKRVLPTGRNFYSKDVWNVPTPWAYNVSIPIVNKLLRAYYDRSCCWLKAAGISVWATSNMRTGGDDVAIVLRLMSVKPIWELSSLKVIGFEIMPLIETRLLRVNVLVRVSGLFRDVCYQVINKLHKLFEIVSSLRDACDLSFRFAEYSLFSSEPGYYGVGIQELLDSGCWANCVELANKYINYGCYHYNGLVWKKRARQFANVLSNIQVVLQSQDNREHDILDSDDYYQFEGGMAAAVRCLRSKVCSYHIDTSRALENNIKIRRLKYEIDRVLKCRLLNRSWILSVLEYGYRGASELVANLSYFCNFALTSLQAAGSQFTSVFNVLVADTKIKRLILLNNDRALIEIKRKLFEATLRGVWSSVSNSVKLCLET